jgi:hypothetical protein
VKGNKHERQENYLKPESWNKNGIKYRKNVQVQTAQHSWNEGQWMQRNKEETIHKAGNIISRN